MRRREFITLLGGTATAWPLAARAQQSAMPVIGFLSPSSPEAHEKFVAGFRKGLGEAGYVDGRNVAIEYRWAYGESGRLLELAAVIPGVRRITLMFNPATAPYYPVFLGEFRAAASPLPAQVSVSPVRNETEIDAAVTTFGRESGGGLIAAPDPFINTYRALIISLAYLHRLPTLFAFRQHVRDGGLMSYEPDSVDIVRRSASYVDRILRGAKPAELPVQAPTKYELAINLKTAKALGLEIPPTLLARADEVIE